MFVDPVTPAISNHNQLSVLITGSAKLVFDVPAVPATKSKDKRFVPLFPIVDLFSILNVTPVLSIV